MHLIILFLLVAIAFWGFVLGPLRRAFLKGRVQLNQQKRDANSLICPECGSLLTQGRDHAIAHHQCGDCAGHWFSKTAFEGALANARKPLRDWICRDSKGGLPCPKCAQPMRLGTFTGEDFPVSNCAACASFWLGRIEWVSLGLRVLG